MQTNIPPLNRSGYEARPPQPSGNATTKIVVAVLVVLGVLFLAGFVAGAAVVIWRMRTRPAKPVTVTASDMSTIALEQTPETRTRLATNEAARKDFAKNVRELLAVAEEAKLKGLADRPDVKRQIALTRAITISDNYWKSQGVASSASASEVEALFKEPGQEERFAQFVKDAQANNPEIGPQLSVERLKESKQQFGQASIGERRGIAAGIDKIRGVELRIMLEQARVLASIYAKEPLALSTKPTEPEIDAYIAGHPTLTHDQARAALEQEKGKAAIDEIVKRQGTHIIVAEDFTVSAPPAISQPTSPQPSSLHD